MWHTDGNRKGRAHPFSLLLGVVLSDTILSNMGNLAVWPRSHHPLHRCSIDNEGTLDLKKLRSLLPLSTSTATADKGGVEGVVVEEEEQGGGKEEEDLRPWVASEVGATSRSFDLGSTHRPLSLSVGEGDIVLLAPDLAHAGGPNGSGDIR